jgi:MYXO-CTERM domain-containing protein
VSGANNINVHGIDGNTAVGVYTAASGNKQGFIYNISSGLYMTLAGPPGTLTLKARGISGDYVVGQLTTASGAFDYYYSISLNSYTVLTPPGPLDTGNPASHGVSGDYMIGTYLSGGLDVGYLYQISTGTYTSINNPLGVDGTVVEGIQGTNIVGYYIDASGHDQGFETSFTPAAVPEPGMLALAGLGGFLLVRRRK